MILLHLADWLSKANPSVEVAYISRGDGALIERFACFGPTLVRSRRPSGGLPRTVGIGLSKAAFMLDLHRFIRRWGMPDLVWNNTMTNGGLLWEVARVIDSPVVTHSHELEWECMNLTDTKQIRLTTQHSTGFVAASLAARDLLVTRLGVDANRVRVVEEFIPCQKTQIGASSSAGDLRDSLKLPPGRQLVVGSGTANWRKGLDLFLQVAIESRRAASHPMSFAWIGGSEAELAPYRWDLERAGLMDTVSLVGERPDGWRCIADADLVLLTSREDCFPLVMLEAGAMAKPVLAFAGSGGADQLLAGMNLLSPYLDAPHMARQLIELLDNPSTMTRIGEELRSRVLTKHDLPVGARAAWNAGCEIASMPGGALQRSRPAPSSA